MKIEDVIALTEAGFTKSEILEMTQQTQQSAQQTQQSAQQTQQSAQQEQTQPPQQNDALLNAITNLTNVIQAGNLAATGLQTKHSQQETADQIAKRMMEIMN